MSIFTHIHIFMPLKRMILYFSIMITQSSVSELIKRLNWTAKKYLCFYVKIKPTQIQTRVTYEGRCQMQSWTLFSKWAFYINVTPGQVVTYNFKCCTFIKTDNYNMKKNVAWYFRLHFLTLFYELFCYTNALLPILDWKCNNTLFNDRFPSKVYSYTERKKANMKNIHCKKCDS